MPSLSRIEAAMTVSFSQHQALVIPPTNCCFHCGEALPKQPFFTPVLGEPRPMCCLGCQLACESILEAGLESYYLDRSVISRTAPLPESMTLLSAYDHAGLQKDFVYGEDGSQCADLSVSLLRCTACSWLIEQRLTAVPGVKQISVNLTQQRLRLVWDQAKVPLSQLLSQIEQLGYPVRPFRQDTHAAQLAQDSRRLLMRLGVAGLGAMQAMMFATSLYLGHYTGMSLEIRDYFRWISLGVSLPVVWYAGWPFFYSAFRAIRARTVNMDVPVSIALGVTFILSAYATLTGTGETYFDSVSMFVFFLLAGRFVEMRARLKASQFASDLVTVEPILAHRITADGIQDVAVQELAPGDVIQIRDGETIPCDGIVMTLNSHSNDNKSLLSTDTQSNQHPSTDVYLSEALISGESEPVRKRSGDTVLGGSQNYAMPFTLQITHTPEGSQQAVLDQLMQRALSERPRIAQQADAMAKWFVARVLVLAVLVFVGWWFVDADRAIWATLAVLVATCPCALSLATPIALTVATNRLTQAGFLITRGHVIEAVATATDVVFDKTGTLTLGQPELIQCLVVQGAPWNLEQCLALAGAMEQLSNHPLARALRKASAHLHLPDLERFSLSPSGGVSAVFEGTEYRLGHADFVGLSAEYVTQWHSAQSSLQAPTEAVSQWVYLTRQRKADDGVYKLPSSESAQESTATHLVVAFGFNDPVRPQTRETIAAVQAQGISVHILSGDPGRHPFELAEQLSIGSVQGGLSPLQKSQQVRQWISEGKTVVMVGDGVNDAPVLGTATVSVAMSSGADLAHLSSDSILLRDDLLALLEARKISQKTRQIIRQNLSWAFAYNLVVLIPAALGYVPPWLAAIGMSVSSLLVVMNAMRLAKTH